MSVRMRHTRGQTGSRRSHHALKATNVLKDKETGNLRLPHRIDETSGMYRGKQIAPAHAARAKMHKTKGVSTEPATPHVHEKAHEEHMNAEAKSQKGISGKSTVDRPKARSGFGGGA